MTSVNLSASDLSSATLTGATYDNSTVWPVNFDPAAAGASLVSGSGGDGGSSSVNDGNNTVFIVSGGQLTSPFYEFSFEQNGSTVDFES